MRKRFILLATLILILSAFAACNENEENSNSGERTTGERTIIVVNNGVPISLEAIDQSYYAIAQSNYKMIYSGTTYSSQINVGVAELATREPWCAWSFTEGTYGLPGDLGNPDYTTWESRTRNYLDTNTDVNVCMWSWSGQVGYADVEASGHYLDLMEGLIRDYPNVTFIFMTGHCDGNGPSGSVHIENEKIRAHCLANNRWFFDFADFDATDPAGVNYLDRNVNGRGSYDGGNWTEEWYNAHPGDWHSCSCAHSSDAHQSLNCYRKAIGFVYMMAKIAGWDGI